MLSKPPWNVGTIVQLHAMRVPQSTINVNSESPQKLKTSYWTWYSRLLPGKFLIRALDGQFCFPIQDLSVFLDNAGSKAFPLQA